MNTGNRVYFVPAALAFGLIGLTIGIAWRSCSLRSPLRCFARKTSAPNLQAQSVSVSPREEFQRATPVSLKQAYGKLPLSFEANRGQLDPSVSFQSHGLGYSLSLSAGDAVLALRTSGTKLAEQKRLVPEMRGGNIRQPVGSRQSVIRMKFSGANPKSEALGLDRLPGIVNYFIGNDPAKWRTNIPTYQKIEYKNIYAGVDLVYYGNEGQLEYDLIVAPGADPTQIALAFEGTNHIEVDEHRDLRISVPTPPMSPLAAATIRMHKPVVYQLDDYGRKHLLEGGYVIRSAQASIRGSANKIGLHTGEVVLGEKRTTEVAFQVASYDANRPLIIDPVLSWATYLGGRNEDYGFGIAVDQNGNAYVTGHTDTGFPSGAGQFGSAFVTRINAAGTAVLYTTYLGGSGLEDGLGIAVDQAGNAYVTGDTSSEDFPVTPGSIQTTGGGPGDGFITKLNANGTALLYSTYLGGSGVDEASAIAVDHGGNAYVTGSSATPGSGFPGTSTTLIQSTNAGDFDAFVTKINAAGTAIVYSTYLGGTGRDFGNGIAVDQGGNAYVTGVTATQGSGFPGTVPGTIFVGAFVTKINAGGTAIVFSTYLGDTSNGRGIAVDQVGNAYVTGGTGNTLPGTATSAIQSTYAGNGDAFVVKINAAGTAPIYSTYLGGSGDDFAFGIVVDQWGNAYVTGTTNTPGTGFPGTAASMLQSTFGGGAYDAFVTKVNPAGTALVYSTYLGGSGEDQARGIAVDGNGDAYVTGYTLTPGSGFPGTENSPIQSMFAGGVDFGDAFVAKISSVTFAGVPGTPNCHGQTVSGLARQFGGLEAAASALGFPSVQALQNAIRIFCRE